MVAVLAGMVVRLVVLLPLLMVSVLPALLMLLVVSLLLALLMVVTFTGGVRRADESGPRLLDGKASSDDGGGPEGD